MKKNSGQVLLVASLLFLVLVLVIPILVMNNRSSTHHNVGVEQRFEGMGVAQQGLSFAMQELSRSTVILSTSSGPGVASPGPNGGDDAAFITQNVPFMLIPGEQLPVSVSFQNSGTNDWNIGAYHLRVRNTSMSTWNTGTINLGGSFVAGSRRALVFDITAPANPGLYEFQWGMRRGGNDFGQYSRNQTIRVTPLPAPPPQWPYLGGGLPPEAIFPSVQGSSFSVTYTSAPNTGLRSYQVGVLTRSLDPLGREIPGTKVSAHISPRTVGVKLPSGIGIAASLQLNGPQPIYGLNSRLAPLWGPVVVYSTGTFNVGSWMDTTRSPRKFANNGITGATYPRSLSAGNSSTDAKEYWADADIGIPTTIDLNYYRLQAKQTTSAALINAGGTTLPNGWVCNPTSTCLQSPANSGYFFVSPGSTLTVTGVGGDWNPAWYASDANTNVLYFDGGMNGSGGGNVEFKDVAIEMRARGAIIVTGNMMIGSRQDFSGLFISTVAVPVTAPLDETYGLPRGDGCVGWAGRECPVGAAWASATGTVRPSIRAFIYAMRDLQVKTHALGAFGTTTNVIGTLRVDGQLRLDDNVDFFVFLDAEINRAIRTSPFEVQIDSVTFIP